MRVTLDTNILVYATEKGERRHAMAAQLLKRAANADCIQTLQSLGECFQVLWRRRGFNARECLYVVGELRKLFRIVAATEEDSVQASHAAAAHRMPFWDAMMWATARRAGCRLILTEDVPGLPALSGVEFVDPFDPANEKLLRIALPPLEA